jgi:hypothetical protein
MMHSRAMWPVHGKYICPDCLREYPVIWESLPSNPEYSQPVERHFEPPRRSLMWSARLAVEHVVGSLKRFDTM